MNRSIGTPTWIDFGSNDFAASKAFYEQLFGWQFEDSGEAMGHYNMITTKDGAMVGGGMDTTGMTCPEGNPIPSSWDVYLAVDDVDARTKLAAEKGAHVIVEPGDAGAAGRFSMVLDPTGATIGMWKSGDTEGYDFSMNVGTPVWFELMSQDIEATKQFYTEVFDFQPVPMAESMDDAEAEANYFTNGPADSSSSGLCNAQGFIPAEMGSYWRTYFRVEDCDAAAQRVSELGGKVLDGPEDSPFGRLATIQDPAGATLMIIDTDKKVQEGQS